MKKRKCGEMSSRDMKKMRIAYSTETLPNVKVEWVFHGDSDKQMVEVSECGKTVTVNEVDFCRALSCVFYGLCGDMSSTVEGNYALPSMSDIQTFITKIIVESEMEYCCGIIGLIYIVRAEANHRTESCDKEKPFIDQSNWRSILLSSLVIASKLYDDGCMTNEDFADIFCSSGCVSHSDLSLTRLNQLEVELLLSVRHNLYVCIEEYNTYANMVQAELQLLRYLNKQTTTYPDRPMESNLELAVVSDSEDEKEQERQHSAENSLPPPVADRVIVSQMPWPISLLFASTGDASS